MIARGLCACTHDDIASPKTLLRKLGAAISWIPHSRMYHIDYSRSIVWFSIPIFKIHLIAWNNGANAVKEIQEAGYNSLLRFIETLQLITDCLLEQSNKIHHC